MQTIECPTCKAIRVLQLARKEPIVKNKNCNFCKGFGFINHLPRGSESKRKSEMSGIEWVQNDYNREFEREKLRSNFDDRTF